MHFKRVIEHLKTIAVPIVFIFLMGTAKGVRDALQFHTAAFHKVLPSFDKDFWNTPEKTWCNKYISCEDRRESFFMSSGTLVFLTDGWHLMEFLIVMFSIGATIFYIRNRLWWFVVMDFILLWIVRQIGFHLMYNVIF